MRTDRPCAFAGGRWNPKGIPAVYLAESRALAALEVLVHAPREALALDWRIIAIDLPADRIETPDPASLPPDWGTLPSSPAARRHGAAWLMNNRALALRLPSILIPAESILLLNPRHPDYQSLHIPEPESLRFDPRI